MSSIGFDLGNCLAQPAGLVAVEIMPRSISCCYNSLISYDFEASFSDSPANFYPYAPRRLSFSSLFHLSPLLNFCTNWSRLFHVQVQFIFIKLLFFFVSSFFNVRVTLIRAFIPRPGPRFTFCITCISCTALVVVYLEVRRVEIRASLRFSLF